MSHPISVSLTGAPLPAPCTAHPHPCQPISSRRPRRIASRSQPPGRRPCHVCPAFRNHVCATPLSVNCFCACYFGPVKPCCCRDSERSRMDARGWMTLHEILGRRRRPAVAPQGDTSLYEVTSTQHPCTCSAGRYKDKTQALETIPIKGMTPPAHSPLPLRRLLRRLPRRRMAHAGPAHLEAWRFFTGSESRVGTASRTLEGRRATRSRGT